VTFADDRSKLKGQELKSMAAKKAKRAAIASSTSTPYDPLDLRTLAASMAKVVLEQPVHPLANVPVFEGAGVYIIYYTGDYEPYKSITQKNKDAALDD
jgi:hypothetical protein